MDSSSEIENVSDPVGSLSSVSFGQPFGLFFSDAIKHAMGTFATAHQQSMADMANKNVTTD